MIYFTAGGSLYEAFASQFSCSKHSIRHHDMGGLMELLQDGDVIIHNAANIASTDLSVSVNDNFILTKNLADHLSTSPKKIFFIFISSMSFLKNEDEYKRTDEMTTYAYSKFLAETYCLKLPLQVSCVRFSTLFYADPKKDGLSKLIVDAVANKSVQTINDGVDKRDFIPLKIAVEYLYKVANTSAPKPIYNIASGSAVSFSQVVSIIKRNVPSLEVSNKQLPAASQPILSTFSKGDISALGEVEFDLEDHIKTYIKQQ